MYIQCVTCSNEENGFQYVLGGYSLMKERFQTDELNEFKLKCLLGAKETIVNKR